MSFFISLLSVSIVFVVIVFFIAPLFPKMKGNLSRILPRLLATSIVVMLTSISFAIGLIVSFSHCFKKSCPFIYEYAYFILAVLALIIFSFIIYIILKEYEKKMVESIKKWDNKKWAQVGIANIVVIILIYSLFF